MIILPEAEADLDNARDWSERQRGGSGLRSSWALRRCLSASAARQR